MVNDYKEKNQSTSLSSGHHSSLILLSSVNLESFSSSGRHLTRL